MCGLKLRYDKQLNCLSYLRKECNIEIVKFSITRTYTVPLNCILCLVISFVTCTTVESL